MNRMVSVELYVDNVGASARFFQDQLGFEPERVEGTFAVLWFDTTRVMLNSVNSGEFFEPNPILKDGALAHRGAGLELVISTPDIESLYERLQNAGLPYLGPLTEQYWGLRDFRFLMPDGFYVRITEPDDGLLSH